MYHMRQNTRITNQIKQLMLFDGCNGDLLEKMLSDEGVSCGIGEWEHFRGICVLLKGTAMVVRNNDNGMMLMSKLKRGDVFGAATILNDGDFFAPHIQPCGQIQVLCIAEKVWLRWLHEDYSLMKNYLHYVNARLQFLNIRLDALSKSNIECRVLSFLRASARDGLCKIESYTELAMMLCVGRASLYRALDALEQNGQLVRNKKEITLRG